MMDFAAWRQARQFNPQKQAQFLHKIQRLSLAGMLQKDIVGQVMKYGTAMERKVAQDVASSLANGRGFADGIRPWLISIAYQSLKAGEHIGDFQQGLNDALAAIETQNTSTTVLINALTTPIIGIIALFGTSALAANYVYPMLSKQLPRPQWGALSSFSESFGLFFGHYGVYLLLLFALICIGIVIALPLWVGEHRKKVDNGFVFRQYRLIHTAHFLNSISNQTLSGIGIKESLSNYISTTPPYVAWHIHKMLTQIRQGKNNVGDIFDVQLLNQEEQETLTLLGGIDTLDPLKKSAEMHQELLVQEVALIQSIGKNTLKLLGAFVFGLTAGGIISLIFNIATHQMM